MGIVEKWNKFAKKSIYINHTLEIPVGRLIFSIIVTALAFFQIDVIAWLIPLFAIKKRQKEEEKNKVVIIPST